MTKPTIRYKILTLFPELIKNYVENNAPLKRGLENGILQINAVNFRDYSENRFNKVDDIAYGGGPGMLIQSEPVYKAVKANCSEKARIFIMDPRGRKLDMQLAKEISAATEVCLICGRYEGFDARLYSELKAEMISLGDFVLTGGELCALSVLDASARFIPGVLEKFESLAEESFNQPLLEYDHFTRPNEWKEKKVPEVLLTGHHKNISQWRLENSLKNTIKNRPDLLKVLNLNSSLKDLLINVIRELYHVDEHRRNRK